MTERNAEEESVRNLQNAKVHTCVYFSVMCSSSISRMHGILYYTKVLLAENIIAFELDQYVMIIIT